MKQKNKLVFNDKELEVLKEVVEDSINSGLYETSEFYNKHSLSKLLNRIMNEIQRRDM